MKSSRQRRHFSNSRHLFYFSVILIYTILQFAIKVNHVHNIVMPSLLQINGSIRRLASSYPQCSCVECEEDEVCGGLWKADCYPPKIEGCTNPDSNIHIIISHCKNDLHWVSNFIKDYEDSIASIHIITKCNAPVNGAPADAIIKKLPNLGRCDHTYAYYITKLLDKTMEEYGTDVEDSIVVFLKDDISYENNLAIPPSSFESMVHLASSSNGFACDRAPDISTFNYRYPDILDEYSCSAYHSPYLFTFTIGEYERNIKGYDNDVVDFTTGKYPDLGSFYNYLDVGPMPDLVQVCYGGVFAASVENIKKINDNTWKKVEKALSRGNNIQEGHYMERLWAPLLSKPLEWYQIYALEEHLDNRNRIESAPYDGMLCRKLEKSFVK